MAQRVQVSTSIRDRQIYQTLQKMAKGLVEATTFIQRATGSVSFSDATASPGTPTLVETVTIETGYVPLEREKLSLLVGNLYNFSNSTFTGTIGAESTKVVQKADGEVVIIADLWTAGDYSFTDLSADWVLLELKP